jgi:allantoicase
VLAHASWTPLLTSTSLRGDSHHLLAVVDDGVWSHLRVHIYPDGGVARLRVYGRPAEITAGPDGLTDLAAQINGLKTFRTPSRIVGVLLNDCTSALYKMLLMKKIVKKL